MVTYSSLIFESSGAVRETGFAGGGLRMTHKCKLLSSALVIGVLGMASVSCAYRKPRPPWQQRTCAFHASQPDPLR